jgi:aldehyde dehydrogenase family 7 protein A1
MQSTIFHIPLAYLPSRIHESPQFMFRKAAAARYRTVDSFLRFMSSSSVRPEQRYAFLSDLGLSQTTTQKGVCDGYSWYASGPKHTQINPATGEVIGTVEFGSGDDYERAVKAMLAAKEKWALTPAPVRGEVVRQIGQRIREKQHALGALVSAEMGKILPEGIGEVQEAVDICDFAVGLSRTLNGSVIPSERPGHFMMERWNPLQGCVGIISAFNFPCAVYFWNVALSLVCGNVNLWKPAETTSLVAIAFVKLVQDVLKESGHDPAVATLVCGHGKEIGEALIQDPRMELVSFTGSTAVGRHVNQVVAGRFGRALLELGGNNAMIIDRDADLDLAVRAALFGAVGTAGQRCTSLRRLFLHADVYEEVLGRLKQAYASVKIGDPLDSQTLCGPLHRPEGVKLFTTTVAKALEEGGKVLVGGQPWHGVEKGGMLSHGNFVQPTVVEVPATAKVLEEEAFVPVMYVVKIKDLQEGVKMNNSVRQGLSSALFTSSPTSVFEWTGPTGSDCGIVNVNIGTSGAEIGGAFGGNKETGWGRESGSDAWKQYMRRSTCTINHSKELPLAQGINFGGGNENGGEGKIMD